MKLGPLVPSSFPPVFWPLFLLEGRANGDDVGALCGMEAPFNRPRLKVTPLHLFYRLINYRMNALGRTHDALTVLEARVFELFSSSSNLTYRPIKGMRFVMDA